MDEEALRAALARTVPEAQWDRTSTAATLRPETAPTLLEPSLASGERPAPAPADPGATLPWAPPDSVPVAARGYGILGEIGRGGMGVVYRARQESLAREVAIKRIKAAKAPEEARARFVAEAVVTGALDHPNIVPVHELGTLDDGDVFISMKLVSGLSWKDLLHPKTDEHRARAAAMDLVKHLSVLTSVCNAVAFAHKRGVLHRDLKPENVMVGELGEVLLMDWGIAVSMGDVSFGEPLAPVRAGATLPAGTPCYMAPELAEGRGADQGPWTDVYLLGAILHEVLTGRPPHHGGSLFQTILLARKSAPPSFPEEVPSELRTICARALSREPGERHASALELRSAIEGFLAHRESTAISDRSAKIVERCSGPASDRLYGDFAEAIAGFRQALVLWPENPAARAGERRARIELAGAALSGGDLGLASAQVEGLAEDVPEKKALAARIAAERARRARAARTARTMRAALVAATFIIIVGLAAGIALVRAEERRTAEQRDAAIAREREARHNLAGVFLEKAGHAEAERDGTAAERLLARALALEDTPAVRARLLAARVSCWRVAWSARAHTRGVTALVVSPDGRTVASSGADEVQLRELATGRLLATRRQRTAVVGLSLAGGRLLTRDARVARVWESLDKDAIAESSGLGLLAGAVLSPDGTRALLAGRSPRTGDGVVEVLDVASNTVVGGVTIAGPVQDPSWSPDGKLLAFAADRGGVVVAEAANPAGTARTVATDLGEVAGFFANASGAWVVACQKEGTLRLQEVLTGRAVETLAGVETDLVLSTTASGDLQRVCVLAQDRPIRMWETGYERPSASFRAIGEVEWLALSPDGRRVVLGRTDGTVEARDFQSAPEAVTLRGFRSGSEWASSDVAFASDGSRVVTVGGDGTCRIHDAATGMLLATASGVLRMASSSLGVLATRDGARTIVLRDPGTLRALGEIAFEASAGVTAVSDMALSADGKLLATTNDEATALVRVPSGDPVWRLPVPGIGRGMAFSPDGRRVAVVTHGALVLLDAAHGEVERRLPFVGYATGVTFGPDGRDVALAGDGVRVWNAATGEQVLTLGTGQTSLAVAFQPGGRVLASGSREGLVQLTDLETGTTRLAFTAPGGVGGLAFDKDGRRLAVASVGGASVYDLRAVGAFFALSPEALEEQAERRTGFAVQGLELRAAR